MSLEHWKDVDAYIQDSLVREDDALADVVARSARAGLPPHQVSPAQGKLLLLLTQMTRARRVLEIGTLGGYSTVWLARAVAAGGRVVTLEANERHAAVARESFARAGVTDRVELLVGRAADSLAMLVHERKELFDLVFVDADKPNNPEYLEAALALTRPGSVLVFDNVIRDGAVIDANSSDASVRGIRQTFERIAAEPRLTATALQTVGAKGHDGFAIALVTSPRE